MKKYGNKNTRFRDAESPQMIQSSRTYAADRRTKIRKAIGIIIIIALPVLIIMLIRSCSCEKSNKRIPIRDESLYELKSKKLKPNKKIRSKSLEKDRITSPEITKKEIKKNEADFQEKPQIKTYIELDPPPVK